MREFRPDGRGAVRALLLLTTLSVLTFTAVHSANAQTYRTLHEFTGGADGAEPGGLTLSPDGELYGVTNNGGDPSCYSGCGTIFELFPSSKEWHLTVLHAFRGLPDGSFPYAPMIFGADGNLYGTTATGGTPSRFATGLGDCQAGCGTIFELQRQPALCEGASCRWKEVVLYRFPGAAYGSQPGFDAPINFDRAGNLYGTAQTGGSFVGICNGNYGCGVVFELSPSADGWTEKVLYTFAGATDGAWPGAGLIFDKAGNLYGTTTWTAFQLAPNGSQWDFHLILQTPDTIFGPGLSLDPFGNLYGGTEDGGTMGGGNVFKIMPAANDSWNVQSIYSFVPGGGHGNYYPGPSATMIMDAAGNLYGVTEGDGVYGLGSVFRLSPSGGGEPWNYTFTDLHDFSGGDGSAPTASLLLDAKGNLYGTTELGGNASCNCGVVFEIEGATTAQINN